MPELRWEGKYDSRGQKVAPLRAVLPFQTVETVNESAQERQKTLDLFGSGAVSQWRNRLIWGDKKYVLPALLDEFAGKVDLIYIDPPFATGADFSLPVTVGEEEFTKEPSLIEVKAYRDTWGRADNILDSYAGWFYDTAVILRELLAPTGNIYVHLDWRVVHYAKLVLDEVFSRDNFLNEIVWQYKYGGRGAEGFGRKHDTILRFGVGPQAKFNLDAVRIPVEEGSLAQNYRHVDEAGRRYRKGTWKSGKEYRYYADEGRTPDDVWSDINSIHAADKERIGYPTQKPEQLLQRIILASSDPGDLVVDVFCGSGTTAAVAEQLGRRWIAADLSRFAVHTTRKRLLDIGNIKPFEVQNLGKYERQAWQRAEFSDDAAQRELRYRAFVLKLYGATPVQGRVWLHGLRGARMVHVGAVDAPVSPADVTAIVAEFKKAVGKGAGSPKTNAIDTLGWDFAFELNEVSKQHAAKAGVNLRMVKIPSEVMDRRAVDQGDILFFELAALELDLAVEKLRATVALTDFVIPGDVPDEVRSAVKSWADWVDYWAVDWNYRDDTFHNEWQSYRTRKAPKLERKTTHTYEAPGTYTVVVKVIDILGNDTTKALTVVVK